jgi:hypothetical protein
LRKAPGRSARACTSAGGATWRRGRSLLLNACVWTSGACILFGFGCLGDLRDELLDLFGKAQLDVRREFRERLVMIGLALVSATAEVGGQLEP